ncbi:MAG: 16S rRNA (uracil(1498)-N(3))-methyltransferase [Bacteroidetes bacterium]|nr:16S rRNA (uracil(1498)-N(3))-methyltransferase [Bacteroidota bacterium]MBP6722078.1 16S rRNA (uracil(1498)-N(3))-methyltransferase [Bacteroidia bacterium]
MTPFYVERLAGDIAHLSGEEAHHCIKVMRKKVGEDIVAIDGQGHMLVCRITALGKDSLEMRIVERHTGWGEKEQQIALLISPLHKPDRFEWLMEKSVELGVTDIYPYVGKHTVKTGIRKDRMERIMIAALKQCMRSKLPTIHESESLKKTILAVKGDIKLIAHADLGKPLQTLGCNWEAAKSVVILIGPEGDFSQEELDDALSKGFLGVSLGKNRLRSETAAIHLLGLVKNFALY